MFDSIMKKNIIQISPTFPPNIGGVGHYSDLLGRYLFTKGFKSKFFISDFSSYNLSSQKLFGKNSSGLLMLLEKSNSKEIILHYSPYGYATWGLCLSLIQSIKKWKKRRKERRLITVFHEIYATGPIYRASFWTYVPQKYLAKILFKMTDLVLTTTKKNKFFLSSIEPKKKVLLSNVFSNIGEQKYNKNINKKKTAIIFGGCSQKELLYQNMILHQKKYINILTKLSIDKIVDIGPKTKGLKKIGQIPIQSIGIKSRRFISNLFSNSKAGLVFYPVGQMTKSGIVASYSSHGLVIINFCKDQILKNNDFISGVNFVSDIVGKKDFSFEKIAEKAYLIYKKNDIRKTGSLIVNFLKKSK
jgi:hypothetical protein